MRHPGAAIASVIVAVAVGEKKMLVTPRLLNIKCGQTIKINCISKVFSISLKHFLSLGQALQTKYKTVLCHVKIVAISCS